MKIVEVADHEALRRVLEGEVHLNLFELAGVRGILAMEEAFIYEDKVYLIF